MRINFKCIDWIKPRVDKKTLWKSVVNKYGLLDEIETHSQSVAEGLWECEKKLITKYFRLDRKVLNIGCGGGREAIALLKQGFTVTGVDVQEKMVMRARENALREKLYGNFLVMDAAQLAFVNNVFPYVLMVGSIICHIPGRANRVNVLREVKRVLKTGGIVVLSTVNRESHLKYKLYFSFAEPWRRLCRACFKQGVLEDGDRFGRHVTLGKTPDAVYIHMYSMREMIEDIQVAGLRLIECRSRFELEQGLEEPSKRTKDYFLYFVAQKDS